MNAFDNENRMRDFKSNMTDMMNGQSLPFTLIMDDPSGKSFLQVIFITMNRFLKAKLPFLTGRKGKDQDGSNLGYIRLNRQNISVVVKIPKIVLFLYIPNEKFCV